MSAVESQTTNAASADTSASLASSTPASAVDTSSTDASTTEPVGGGDLGPDGYPEQKHAGKVGYGPNYKQHPTTGDKIEGTKDIIKGKIMRKPDLVQEGQEKKTGEFFDKEKEKDEQEDPFKKEEDTPAAGAAGSKSDAVRENGAEAKNDAATVATDPK